MRYKDKRGWLFKVDHGTYGWTIYCYNPKKEICWRWPWPCANWHGGKKEAEMELERHAKKRKWDKVQEVVKESCIS